MHVKCAVKLLAAACLQVWDAAAWMWEVTRVAVHSALAHSMSERAVVEWFLAQPGLLRQEVLSSDWWIPLRHAVYACLA
jgi:hypothetical protein